ncbi:gamma-glutamyl-gamma-aminobutyrate hydrolase family protein [Pseudokordiimonas caeni]|uniref:gamma-glutamyl-gamma-aminobutyrate hydrolase family protein n=1 Tax=Pseudokordiimonas caeni TaxID=2997908 RepID=UPI00281158C7|nr:gamma-glutamyl-gamma-aminobutyrate hydrolase family protein [Pseudokordiimonas caeni]
MLRTRPVIGVTCSDQGAWFSWTFNRLAVLRSAGTPVRITPSDPVDIDRLDGLVVGGGDDIGAEIYGGELRPNVRFDAKRDALERDLIDKALAREMPVLGVCRGSQMINVHLGGTLIQDIVAVYKRAPRGRVLLPRRRVMIDQASRLGSILGRQSVRVNSLHRQAVDRLGQGLVATAHDRDGMTLAVEDPSRPCLVGVQWHPEYLPWDSRQLGLFRFLCRQAVEQGGCVTTA